MYELLPTAATSLRGNRGTQLDTFIRPAKFNVQTSYLGSLVGELFEEFAIQASHARPIEIAREQWYIFENPRCTCVYSTPLSDFIQTLYCAPRNSPRAPYYRATTAGLAFTANEIALIKQAAPKVPADAVNAALVVYPRDQMRSIIKEFA